MPAFLKCNTELMNSFQICFEWVGTFLVRLKLTADIIISIYCFSQ